jgi:hypothetical protein
MSDLSVELKREEVIRFFDNLNNQGPVSMSVKDLKASIKQLIGTEPAIVAKYSNGQLITENNGQKVEPVLEKVEVTFFDGTGIQKVSIML